MGTGYIPDGYTRWAVVSAVPRLYPRVAFLFRPLLQRDRSIVAAQAMKAGPGKDADIQAACVARQIVEWDVSSGDGVVVSVTPETVARVQPELLQRLYAIVLGLDGGDEDVDSEPDKTATELLEAALSGSSATAEEHDAKN